MHLAQHRQKYNPPGKLSDITTNNNRTAVQRFQHIEPELVLPEAVHYCIYFV
jgi:hypothetical protein